MASLFDNQHKSASLLQFEDTLAECSEAAHCQGRQFDSLRVDASSCFKGGRAPCDSLSDDITHVDCSSAKPCLPEIPTFRFTGEAPPRQIPSDLNEATSVMVGDVATAADVSNMLYDYVTSEVKASYVKINPEKYTVKADICLPFEGTCTLKMCVYSKAPESGLVVEFSRRRGDAIAFNRIFRHAMAYLQCQLSKGRETCPEREKDLIAPEKARMNMEADMQPLLDMLSREGAGPAQTEAAVLLSAMAAVNSAVAAHLCSTLSSLPVLHRLEEHVLACAFWRSTDIFLPVADF